MSLRGRFFSKRDLKVIGSWNGELMGDIIQTTIILFKMAADQTKTNIYDFYNLTPSKIKNLPFDSIIRGRNVGGIYTHWVDDEPMFLMQSLIDGKWEDLDYYCVGVTSFSKTIKAGDSKK